MIVSVRKSLRRLYWFLLFAALTCLFYNVMSLLQEWSNPLERSREIPEGSAVRAFRSGAETIPAGEGKPGDRLRLFYWYGE